MSQQCRQSWVMHPDMKQWRAWEGDRCKLVQPQQEENGKCFYSLLRSKILSQIVFELTLNNVTAVIIWHKMLIQNIHGIRDNGLQHGLCQQRDSYHMAKKERVPRNKISLWKKNDVNRSILYFISSIISSKITIISPVSTLLYF